MNEKFNSELGQYLESPIEERDHAKGATLLLQLTRNQIMYRNISINPAKHAKFIDRELRKFYKVRIIQVTHEEVEAMQRQVDVIVKEHCEFTEENPAKSFRKGIREDHEELPVEIQALYKENLSISQKMRELHLQLRALSTDGTSCPDNDRYPFLKELIELDKRLHSNWEKYDHFVVGQSPVAPVTTADDNKIIRQINLNKGKYAKNPSDEMKIKIQSLYNSLSVKPEKITSTLSELGII